MFEKANGALNDRKINILMLQTFLGPLMYQNGGGGVTGGLDPLKNHRNIGFLNNTSPDPLKIHKATTPAIIGTPVKQHLWSVYSGNCLDPL